MKLSGFEAIVRALNGAGVRYLLVGGVAVNAHGYGRNTFDVDIVIQLNPENIEKTFDALWMAEYHPQQPISASDFANRELRESWRKEKNMLVLKFWSDAHRETPLDVFVYEPFDFDTEWAAAWRQEFAPGLQVPVIRLGALQKMKREAGRPQDLADFDELSLLYGGPSSYDREERTGD
jgi:hypothetical protein